MVKLVYYSRGLISIYSNISIVGRNVKMTIFMKRDKYLCIGSIAKTKTKSPKNCLQNDKK